MTEVPDRELAVFSAARRLPPEQRAAYLDEACAGDAPLRQRVEELLQANEASGAFLENPESRPGVTVRLQIIPIEKPGDQIGRYKLLQQIGEGGCGVVYMAEQEEPVRRRVALKVIKLGMNTKEVIARFEAERQALAMMEHPNIAKVLDAGATDTGRPYFVMELVRGIKITDYCDENKVPTAERLKLFIQVCQAIQHAHQKGIIHRDIKPSNILVTVNDGVPVPKVIDFGIAKATQGRLTDATLFTAFEQFIGTPAYMSPEQAMMTSLDIDTRSDIYSLGVLLYELLTGETPFDSGELLQSGIEAMRLMLRDKEPLRPSTRVNTMADDVLTATAQRRHTDAPRLFHLLRGDLDWIVMKALEKDRARRYETANGFVADILRYLHNEPIVARPPSRVYQISKFVRRNKLAFAAAIVIVVLLAGGSVVSTWQAVIATRATRAVTEQRTLAEAEAKKSRETAHFLTEMIAAIRPSQASGHDTTLDMLDNAVNRLDKGLKGQPEVEAALRSTLGEAYWALGYYEKAERLHREALAMRNGLFGRNHPDVAASLYDLAASLWNQGKNADAGRLHREALEIRRKTLGNEHLDVATSLNDLAVVLLDQGNYDESERMLREALVIQRKLLGSEHADVAKSLQNLADVLYRQNNLKEAESTQREALAMRKKLFGEQHLEVAFSLRGLALVLRGQKRLDEAENIAREEVAMLKKLMGNDHPEATWAVSDLCRILRDENKLAEAESVMRGQLAQHVTANVRQRQMLIPGLTLTLLMEEKFQDAEPFARELISADQEHNLADDWRTFNALGMLGRSLAGQKKFTEAEPLLVSAYEGMKQREDKIPLDSKVRIKEALQSLVQLYEATGRANQTGDWKKVLATLAKAAQ